jgi:importin-5
MARYLDDLIGRLLHLLQGGKRIVQEGALTALASVADSAEKHFIKYYDVVMPLLKQILTHATDKTHRLLRGKSIECLSLVGMAVGKERFREDAREVCQYLIHLQSQPMDADDPTMSYMIQAWTRLCKVRGNM